MRSTDIIYKLELCHSLDCDVEVMLEWLFLRLKKRFLSLAKLLLKTDNYLVPLQCNYKTFDYGNNQLHTDSECNTGIAEYYRHRGLNTYHSAVEGKGTTRGCR